MIKLYHVSKAYGKENTALHDINLHIDKGDFVFITGPSGAGKTTLLRLLFCEEKATHGQVLIAGKNLSRLKPSSIPYLRRNIGVVFQDFKLLKSRTVYENIAFVLQTYGMSSREIRRRVHGVLKSVGLAHLRDSLARELSGGEQQRVAIARAVVNDPMILLADEPTGNLDHALTLEIVELLVQINLRGTTVVVATHDWSLMEQFPRRIIKLDGGRIVS